MRHRNRIAQKNRGVFTNWCTFLIFGAILLRPVRDAIKMSKSRTPLRNGTQNGGNLNILSLMGQKHSQNEGNTKPDPPLSKLPNLNTNS